MIDPLNDSGASLTPAELARGRAGGYDLLGRLLLTGMDGDLLAAVREIPRLAVHLPETVELDLLAADHYHLFGLNLFPHASIFLDESGLLGGELAARAAGRLAAIGYQPDGAAADHAGHALRGLAVLCAAEEGAWRDGLAAAAGRQQTSQQGLLDELAAWLWPLLAALQLQPDPFYAALADLTAELIIHHHAPAASPPVLAAPTLAFLDEPQTGIREIARFLLAPVRSGWFLSREDITGFARMLELPRGFGGREQTLTNLFRTAAHYERVPALARLLEGHEHRWRARYAAFQAQAAPGRLGVENWITRLDATRALLARLQETATPPV